MRVLLLFAVAAVCLGRASAACTANHRFVGFEGSIVSKVHNFRGTVRVQDDCTMLVSNFGYDGQEASVYWYYGSEETRSAFLTGGYLEAGNPEIGKADGSQTQTVTLRDGLTWDSIGAIAGWSESLGTDFGSLTLSAPASLPTPLLPLAGSQAAQLPLRKEVKRAACTSNHAFVGRQGSFITRQHRWAGKVTVIDDCTFRVEGFTYDGQGPGAYFWASADTTRSALRAGFRLHNDVLGSADGITVVRTLPAGTTWDNVPVLCGWCVPFTANFGELDLRTATRPPTTTTTTSTTSTSHTTTTTATVATTTSTSQCATASSVAGYDCQHTVTGDLTLHWQRLSLDEVSFLAVYRNAPGWVALSFPETAGLMVPADAVIGAGIVEPYRLTARSISGVVVDDTQTLTGTSLSSSSENVVRMRFTRKADNGGVNVLNFSQELNMNWAKGSSTQLGQHSFSNRGSFVITLGGVTSTTTVAESTTTRAPTTAAPTTAAPTTAAPTTAAPTTAAPTTAAPTTAAPTTAAPTTAAPITAAPTTAAAAGCDKTHAFVGRVARFSSLQHSWAGTVTVVDDCTFRVDDFVYDGTGPTTFFWGAPGTTEASLLDGYPMHSTRLTSAADGITVVYQLPDGKTWDDTPVIAGWCVKFSALFGLVDLRTASVPTTTPTPTTTPMTTPAAGPSSLANCATLILDSMNLYWEVRGSEIYFALEGRGGVGSWMSFGVPPDPLQGNMVGSDVTVVGNFAGTHFATDYYLSDRAQCDYAAGGISGGVCPDEFFGYNDVTLRGSTHLDGVDFVMWSRPLQAGDESHDKTIALTRRSFIYAQGSLSETLTASHPVVLYHNAKRSSKNFKMALGEDSRTCTPFMTLSSTEPPVTTLVPLETLRDATSFVVLTGSNDNYPDPIRWGLSYHINGEESPILELKRGVQYTFMVEAGDSHPLYLTDDRNGGRSNEAETVYAGSEDAFGTPEAPYVLTFTPTAEHPDLLYYQCWYHQKLGWEVRIVDAPTTTATTVAATAPTAATTATTAATTAAMTTEGSACQTASTESGFDCQSVITGELTMHWRFLSDTEVKFLAIFANAPGWVAIAFPESSGQMEPADGVIGRASTVRPYRLTSKTLPGVVVDDTQSLTSTSFTRDGSSTVRMGFTRQADNGGASIIDFNGNINMNWAKGSTDTLAQHSPTNRGSFATSLASGTTTTVDEDAIRQHRRVHGILMGVAWAVLLPLGPVFAHAMLNSPNERKPFWFKLHVSCQLLGLLLATVGYLYALLRFSGGLSKAPHGHAKVGTVVMVLAWLQVLAAVCRPHPGPELKRTLWAGLHWLVGRIAIALGVVNLLIGIEVLHFYNGDDRTPWFVGLAVALIVFTVLLGGFIQRQLSPRRHSGVGVEQSAYESYDTALTQTSRNYETPQQPSSYQTGGHGEAVRHRGSGSANSAHVNATYESPSSTPGIMYSVPTIGEALREPAPQNQSFYRLRQSSNDQTEL